MEVSEGHQKFVFEKALFETALWSMENFRVISTTLVYIFTFMTLLAVLLMFIYRLMKIVEQVIDG